GHCAQSRPDAIGRNAARCAADLGQAPATPLVDDQRVLLAQHIINTVIRTGTARFGIYQADPQPAAIALADLRELGKKIIADVSAETLRPILSTDLIGH